MLKSSSMIALSVPTIALGAALLLTGTGSAGAQEGLFTSERDCTTDVSSLCAGVKPGHGAVLACLQSHVGDLSVGCSTILSKAIWTAQQCAGDIHQFCPTATFGSVGELHATAPRRGERDLQGSDGVYGLSRRRPILRLATSP